MRHAGGLRMKGRREKPAASVPGASARLFARARAVIPGGVNSPVRAFRAVGGTPVFVARGRGARLFSADGRDYLDCCGSWGPLVLGHAHPAVVEAVQRAAAAGTSFGACTEREVELAELLCAQVPPMKRVRLVSSGTEACMTAVRLARAHTGRAKILKFEGGYHGHADPFLVAAGSGLLTAGVASSAGVPGAVAADVLVAPYNDLAAVGRLAERHGRDLAAVIVEPVAGNMGLVPPVPGFLEGLRRLTRETGAVLIFDEVITGFRLGPTTAGVLRGIAPDLTCLGKIVGGGLPIGAVGGRAAIMNRLAPLGDVYQAGTLSGNPVAVAAGLATLRTLIAENPYARMATLGGTLARGVDRAAAERGVTAHGAQLGSLFTVFFGAPPVRNLAGVKRCDAKAYARFFRRMLAAGVYLPPSAFETCFLSAAHTAEDVACFLDAAGRAMPPAS